MDKPEVSNAETVASDFDEGLEGDTEALPRAIAFGAGAAALMILAFVLAVLANRVARAQWLFRLAFFVPFILPSAAIALIWTFIYSPTTGLWNSMHKIGRAQV